MSTIAYKFIKGNLSIRGIKYSATLYDYVFAIDKNDESVIIKK